MKRVVLLVAIGVLVAVPIVFWAMALSPVGSLAVRLFEAANVLGLTGFVFLFVQYVLSSRIRWIERGIGLDKLMIIHRTCGITGGILLLVHPAGFSASRVLRGAWVLPTPLEWTAIVGLLMLAVGAIAALLAQRLPWRYETWRAYHRVNYAVLAVAFAHAMALGVNLFRQPLRTMWFVMGGLYVAAVGYRLASWMRVMRRPYAVTAVRQETHDTWTVEFTGPPVDYQPGQFAFIRLVRRGKTSEPHPFTLSSSPAGDALSITVKSVGDFTATVRETTTKDEVLVDAPYGVFSFLNHDGPRLVFIAGGIGITPLMSMLRYMRDTGIEREVVLLWGNKTEDDIAFRGELAAISEKIPSLRVVHVMSSQPSWAGDTGYIDRDLLARHLPEPLNDAQYFLCGPPVMMDFVVAALTELGVARRRIHFERFALR